MFYLQTVFQLLGTYNFLILIFIRCFDIASSNIRKEIEFRIARGEAILLLKVQISQKYCEAR